MAILQDFLAEKENPPACQTDTFEKETLCRYNKQRVALFFRNAYAQKADKENLDCV